ncbi:SagB/ThcOx family dehydrogenase [Paenibacillus paeoniae]|nr:SagB/ThcOx family dehydrogenase [Paenibacillus paeoniae]
MNKSTKQYINVAGSGQQLQYVKVNGQKIPVLIDSDCQPNQAAIDNVEKTLRFFQIEDSNQAIRIANFIYDLLKVEDVDLEMETIAHRLERWVGESEMMRLHSSEETAIYLFQKGRAPENERDLFQRNKLVVSRFDSTSREQYERLALVWNGIEKIPADITLEDAADLYTLANPAVLLLHESNIVEKDLSEETRLSRLYHENSKLHLFYQQGDFMKPLDEIDDGVKKLTLRARKTFYEKSYIELPEPTRGNALALEEIILQRRSKRHYSNEPVELQTLSNILYYSYGVTGKMKSGLEVRAVPSGGGLYPVDIYLAIQHVSGIETGIYYYDPLDHRLACINDHNLKSISKNLSGYSGMLDQAAFTVILGANFWRNQWKYHERGYRVILLDCGHVAQNLHLMCTAYGLGSCCLMGFVDNELNQLLNLDGISEHSMYLITAGKTAKG